MISDQECQKNHPSLLEENEPEENKIREKEGRAARVYNLPSLRRDCIIYIYMEKTIAFHRVSECRRIVSSFLLPVLGDALYC